MAIDHIRYDLLAQEALRGVVRTVLEDAARNGLPGEHHFYITFATRMGGVRLSPRMLEQYPKEMTIVLQHQFWDLRVTDSGFEVGLSFGGVPERLAVPFAAIKGFFDPSVQFGLQFEEITEEAGEEEKPVEGDVLSAAQSHGSRPPAEHAVHGDSPFAAVPAPANQAEPAPSAASAPTGPSPSEPRPAVPAFPKSDGKPGKESEGGAQVVRLDRFRKK
jgi:uncharacterized protein